MWRYNGSLVVDRAGLIARALIAGSSMLAVLASCGDTDPRPNGGATTGGTSDDRADDTVIVVPGPGPDTSVTVQPSSSTTTTTRPSTTSTTMPPTSTSSTGPPTTLPPEASYRLALEPPERSVDAGERFTVRVINLKPRGSGYVELSPTRSSAGICTVESKTSTAAVVATRADVGAAPGGGDPVCRVVGHFVAAGGTRVSEEQGVAVVVRRSPPPLKVELTLASDRDRVRVGEQFTVRWSWQPPVDGTVALAPPGGGCSVVEQRSDSALVRADGSGNCHLVATVTPSPAGYVGDSAETTVAMEEQPVSTTCPPTTTTTSRPPSTTTTHASTTTTRPSSTTTTAVPTSTTSPHQPTSSSSAPAPDPTAWSKRSADNESHSKGTRHRDRGTGGGHRTSAG